MILTADEAVNSARSTAVFRTSVSVFWFTSQVVHLFWLSVKHIIITCVKGDVVLDPSQEFFAAWDGLSKQREVVIKASEELARCLGLSCSTFREFLAVVWWNCCVCGNRNLGGRIQKK